MRQGKQAWDWLVWIMSVGSEAQDCPSYLALVPGVSRAGEWWAGVWECKSSIKEVSGGRALDWLACIWKAHTQARGKSFTISPN